MKKTKKKSAITLLALVITIIILLLLAGVAIQMSFGENGLIVKVVQAQKEQAKAELYDTAKLSYTRLSLQAMEKKKSKPEIDEILDTEEFREKYSLLGDNIVDKKGNFIDTKENVLNMLKTNYVLSEETEEPSQGGETEQGTPQTPEWPKRIAGVTIQEEEKGDLILKLNVLGEKCKINFLGRKTSINYGNGMNDTEINLQSGKQVEYDRGEYVIKISDFEFMRLNDMRIGNYEIEVIQWGEKAESDLKELFFENVSKIHEPEPDKIIVHYTNGKFTTIPEWLFSKKVSNKRSSKFESCSEIKEIPENLFQNCINLERIESVFNNCTGITTIPENLFKNNIKAENFISAFSGCVGLKEIPENLFKHNINVKNFRQTFYGCKTLKTIPDNLFKYNINAKDFQTTFSNCVGLTTISDKVIGDVERNRKTTGQVSGIFRNCRAASNYNSLPSYMK